MLSFPSFHRSIQWLAPGQRARKELGMQGLSCPIRASLGHTPLLLGLGTCHILDLIESHTEIKGRYWHTCFSSCPWPSWEKCCANWQSTQTWEEFNLRAGRWSRGGNVDLSRHREHPGTFDLRAQRSWGGQVCSEKVKGQNLVRVHCVCLCVCVCFQY